MGISGRSHYHFPPFRPPLGLLLVTGMSFLCMFYIIIWIVDFAVPSDDCSFSQIDVTAQMGSSVDMATSRSHTVSPPVILHLQYFTSKY